MKLNAKAVANFLIENSQNELTVLGLLKRLYLVEGYSLAIFDKSILDERFDKVEAWKFGPVIPSVYHSLVHIGAGTIPNNTRLKMLKEDKESLGDYKVTLCEAQLQDEGLENLIKAILEEYKDVTDKELVELLHLPNSPWSQVYTAGKNKEISTQTTMRYYKFIIKD